MRLALMSLTTGAALLLSGCGGAPGSGLACTEVGNAEGVFVNLGEVGLDPQGGEYTAELVTVSPEASNTVTFSGDNEIQYASVETNLTGDPVMVHLVVTGPDGVPVYSASAEMEPDLYQPNGAQCDGENYALSLVATADGGLVRADVEG